MKRRAQLVSLVLGLMVTPATASADWFISPFLGLKFAGKTTIVDPEQGASKTKLTLGVSAAILSDEVFGIEGELGYSPRFFERTGDLVARSNVTTLMGNVIVAVPKRITRDSLRPYAVAGAGLMHVGIRDVAGLFPVSGNLVGFSVGGGAMGRLTDRTSLRFEVRHIHSIGGELPGFFETEVSYWRATAGIAFLSNLF